MKKRYLLIFSIFVLICSCNDDACPDYSNCCRISAIDESVGNGQVFIPNVFSPDYNGNNDRFIIYGDLSIQVIEHLIITNVSGEVVHEIWDLLPNDAVNAWDGTFEGEVQIGLHSFLVEIKSNDGVTKMIEGQVCSFPCSGSEMKIEKFESLNNCIYGELHDGLGSIDLTLSSGENGECLE